MQSFSQLQPYIRIPQKILYPIFLLLSCILLTNCIPPLPVEMANPTAAIIYCHIQAVDYMETEQQTQGSAVDRYEVIKNAQVTLNVADRQPMTQVTDTEGIAIFLIDQDRINQVGTLAITYNKQTNDGQPPEVFTKTIVLSDICKDEDPIPIRFSKEFVYMETTVPNVSVNIPAASIPLSDSAATTTPTANSITAADHPATATATAPPDHPEATATMLVQPTHTPAPLKNFQQQDINLPPPPLIHQDSFREAVTFEDTLHRVSLPQTLQARNFTFAIDTTIQYLDPPTENLHINLIFREDDNRNYYMVRIGNAGQVLVYRHDGDSKTWDYIESAMSSTSWNPRPQQTNRLQIDVQNNTLTVRINNQQILQTDQLLANNTGSISLALDGPIGQAAVVEFQNLTLIPLDE